LQWWCLLLIHPHDLTKLCRNALVGCTVSEPQSQRQTQRANVQPSFGGSLLTTSNFPNLCPIKSSLFEAGGKGFIHPHDFCFRRLSLLIEMVFPQTHLHSKYFLLWLFFVRNSSTPRTTKDASDMTHLHARKNRINLLKQMHRAIARLPDYAVRDKATVRSIKGNSYERELRDSGLKEDEGFIHFFYVWVHGFAPVAVMNRQPAVKREGDRGAG
jgi:hypothetical protein